MMTLLLALVLLQAPELRERYHCQGVTPEGVYEMTLHVEKKDDNYYITWTVPQGITAKGVGFLDGDHFTAVFITAKNNIGVIAYRVTKVGLDGKWISGNGMVFSETCTFGKPSQA